MLNENTIELAFIEQLINEEDYTYFDGKDIAPNNSKNPQREAFDSVVLEKHFYSCLV